MNREETTRSGPWTVDTNTNPKIPTHGAPMIAIEVTAATANPIIKVQADFGSGTVRSIRCAHLDGASTETLIPADTNTAALAVQDVLLIPSIGAEFIQLTYVSGTSSTVKATALASTAIDSWVLMKLVSSGVSLDEFPSSAAITDDFANPTTTNIMAMSMLWDGATWDRSKGDSTDGALVNLGANNDVSLNAGSTKIGGTYDVQGNIIDEDGTSATVKYAIIDAASSGDNTLVAAVAGKKIVVLSVVMIAAAAVTVRFEDGAGGTALTGQMNLAANGGFTLPYNKNGWFEGGSNTLLNLELGGAVSVDGCMSYIEVTV